MVTQVWIVVIDVELLWNNIALSPKSHKVRAFVIGDCPLSPHPIDLYVVLSAFAVPQ